jgi:uncharacterized protein YjiS (DUF1127 family)
MPAFKLLLPPQTYSAWHPEKRRAQIPLFAGVMLIALWIGRARQRQALAKLDDHQLRDLGITRLDAARECEKPFWR